MRVSDAEDFAIARAFKPNLAEHAADTPRRVGTSSGVNIEPGSDDDGWVVPRPACLRDGSRVQLYKDGEALRAAFEAIAQAKFRICLEVYIFASDHTGRAFADLLCHKSRQGVEVYLIYDSFGSLGSDRAMFQQMRDAGIHLQAFHPIRPWENRFGWRPFNRNHRKLLVIDDNIVGMGGLNIGSEYAGSWIVPSDRDCCEFWRDNAIGIVGPAARRFLHSFAKSWHYVSTGGRIGKAEYIFNLGSTVPAAIHQEYRRSAGRQAGRPRSRRPTWAGTKAGYHGAFDLPEMQTDADFGILASVPTVSSPLAEFFQKLLHGAKKSIELTMAYFAPSDLLINELCRAAKRGVRVRLMLPARCDVPILIWAARSFYETLMNAGVEIYERQSVVLHAKTLVIDSELTVMGSANLDYRSIEYNLEISALIRSDEFGRQMNDLFENDVLYAKRMLPSEWRKRPIRDRLIQWAVNRARYLL
jgi:cardiolipin synthase